MRSWRPENGNEEEFGNCAELPEEKLVDFVMNRLGESDRFSVAEHVAHCAHCTERLKEWELLMEVPEMQSLCLPQHDADKGNGGLAILQEPLSAGPVCESAELPARLGRKLRVRASLRSLRLRIMRNRRFIFPGAAAAALALFLFVGLNTLKHQADPSSESFERQVSTKIAFMQSAEYKKYPIAPLPPYHGSGGVWINPDSGELLIVVDGLTPSEEKDYQVWLQHEQQSFSAGMMLTRNLQGKGYYYGYGIMNPDRIVISLEPKGGSRMQTGPETVRINVNNQP